MNFEFTQYAWEEFEYWIETDNEVVQKIKELLKDIRKRRFRVSANQSRLGTI